MAGSKKTACANLSLNTILSFRINLPHFFRLSLFFRESILVSHSDATVISFVMLTSKMGDEMIFRRPIVSSYFHKLAK